MTLSRLRFALPVAALLAILSGCAPIPPATTVAPGAMPAVNTATSAPAAPAATATQAPAALATDVLANDCPEPGRGEQLQANAAAGYCLLFPGDYKFQEADGTQTDYFFDSMMDVSRPKLFVKVEDANGQSAAEIADALIAEIEAVGMKDQVKRTRGGIMLGGETAELLDKTPGQDLGRVVIAVHGPRAYRLTFVPDDPSQGDVYKQMEALYDQVVKSFRFLP